MSDWDLCVPDPEVPTVHVTLGHTEYGAPCYWVTRDGVGASTLFTKREVMRYIKQWVGTP